MAKHHAPNFLVAHLTVYAALLLPSYCKILVVDLGPDGEAAQIGTQELPKERKNTLLGESICQDSFLPALKPAAGL